MLQRVLCISPTSYTVEYGLIAEKHLYAAEVYHVTDVQKHHNGKIYFVLAEHGNEKCFVSDLFLVCSELDETLLINHQIKKRK